MNYRLIFICMMFFSGLSLGLSQESFAVKLSKDTVLLGNTITIKFSAENIDGKFEAPEFENLEIVSGPNISSSYQMFNGNSSRTTVYTYVLKPTNIGVSTIPPAYFVSDEVVFETEAIDFSTLPNPDGIIDREETESMSFGFPDLKLDFSFPELEEKPTIPEEKNEKSKRKLKKI